MLNDSFAKSFFAEGVFYVWAYIGFDTAVSFLKFFPLCGGEL